MKTFVFTVLRVLALLVIYLALFMISSSLTTPREMVERFTPEQASNSALVAPVVGLIMTLMIAYLTARSRWHGWKLAAALFAIFYGIYTFLSQIEILAFPAVSNGLPQGTVLGFFIGGLILAAPFSILTVLVMGKARADGAGGQLNERLRMPLTEWVWKLAVAAILYVVIYFAFGYYVAWRTPGLPEFYGGTDPGTFAGQMANVMSGTPWLPPFAAFRGLIWAGIGCIIIRMHKGGTVETIVANGLAFTLLMGAPMLFPNPVFPPEVARAHTIELLSSNLLWGLVLAALMLWRPSTQLRRPSESTVPLKG